MVLNLKCSSCGGVVVMNPETGRLECKQCNSVLNPEIGENNSSVVKTADGTFVDKRSYQELKKAARIKRYVDENEDSIYTLDEINLGADQNSQKYMEMNVYECNSCGARLMVSAKETSSFCAYCGQPLVLVDRVTDELEPDLIIPFGISQTKAEKLIRDRFCKGFFVPKEIKELQVDKIRGIYIPYWLTSVHVRKKLKYTKVKKENTGIYKQYDVSMSRYGKSNDTQVVHHCMKDAECIVLRVPYDASRRLNDNISHRLEPYDTNKGLDFSPEYLSGFYTDRYDVPPKEVIQYAKDRSSRILREEMLSTEAKEESLSIKAEDTECKLTDVEYALLPAWFMTFRYKGILYTVAVNGQNGKVVGNVPADRFKMGVVTILLAVILCVVCVLCSLFAYSALAVDATSDVKNMIMGMFIGGIALCGGLFWKAINDLHKSRLDIHRFRSTGVINYIKERQDKTWVQ